MLLLLLALRCLFGAPLSNCLNLLKPKHEDFLDNGRLRFLLSLLLADLRPVRTMLDTVSEPAVTLVSGNPSPFPPRTRWL